MNKPAMPETALPTVHFNGRTWTPRTALDIEAQEACRRDPQNPTDSKLLQRIAENHADGVIRDCEDLIAGIEIELAFPTLCSEVPLVRQAAVEALAAVQRLKAATRFYRDAGNRVDNRTAEQDFTEGLAALEMQRLQKENAELEAECEQLHREYMERWTAEQRKPAPKPAAKKPKRAAPKKPAKPHAPKPIPKPLFERMTGGVNGNGYHHANGKNGMH